MRQLQQGDVVIERVARMPKAATVKAPSSRGYVLAEGEATGHAHTIAAVEGMEIREAEDGTLYARIPVPVDLRHEEHRPITIPPGTYRVRRVQEYDHFAEEARNIAD